MKTTASQRPTYRFRTFLPIIIGSVLLFIAFEGSFATLSTFGVPAKPANAISWVRDANNAVVEMDIGYGQDLTLLYRNLGGNIYDIVMNQCFGGGFLNALQGRGGPHTFASASAWNEVAWGDELYAFGIFGGPLTSLEDFTRAWWESEASGVTTNRGNYVTAIGGNLAIAQKELFAPPGTGIVSTAIEHPQYESPDAVVGGPNDSRDRRAANLPPGANNYAILVAWSKPETFAAADIARIYNVLTTIDGIPANNIVVLYGNQARGTTIGPFTISGNGTPAATFPAVFVDGPNSSASWRQALSGQLFVNAGGTLGINYGPNDRLFIYNTGHGGHTLPGAVGQQNGNNSRFAVAIYNGFNTANPNDTGILSTVTNVPTEGTSMDGTDVIQISTGAIVDASVQVSVNGQSFGSLAGYYVADPALIRDVSPFVPSPTETYQIAVPHALLSRSQDVAMVDFFNLAAPSMIAAIDFAGGHQEFLSVPTLHICDIDGNGVIDRNDIALILAARNMPALPGDPRDADGDGLITVNDARVCTIICFNSGCAPVH